MRILATLILLFMAMYLAGVSEQYTRAKQIAGIRPDGTQSGSKYGDYLDENGYSFYGQPQWKGLHWSADSTMVPTVVRGYLRVTVERIDDGFHMQEHSYLFIGTYPDVLRVDFSDFEVKIREAYKAHKLKIQPQK